MAADEGEEGEGATSSSVFGDPADSGEGASCRVVNGLGVVRGAVPQAQSMLAPITETMMPL